MVRQFYFRNQDNEIFDLNGRKTDFLNAPQGLGFELDIDTAQLTQSLIPLQVNNSFVNIQGEMLFKEYTDYQTFTNFVTRAEKLFFHQIINSDINEAYVECRVVGLEKSEKDIATSYLKCSITIQPFSLWQVKKTIDIKKLEDETSSSEYLPYTLPFKLAKSTMNANINQLEIVNNGVVDSPLILKVKGISNKPEWYLENETPLTSGGLNVLVQLNQEVIIDSSETNMITTSGQAVLDEYLYTDRKNYLYIPKGKTKLFLRNFYEGQVEWIEQYYTI